jgi:ankyrin repeat protein
LNKAHELGQPCARLAAQLLGAGVDPNAFVTRRDSSFQTTALCEAAANGRPEAVRLLLEGGADPGRVDGDGTTPLMHAADVGQLDVLRLLLADRAVLDAVHPSDDSTAFHCACVNNHVACAEALARAGCDVDIKDPRGRTGLQVEISFVL